MIPIRVTRRSALADEWALVLTAAGIPHRVEPDGGGWSVLVAVDDVSRAAATLAAYDEETPREPAPLPPPPATPEFPWMFGVVLGLVLLGAFALTGPPAAASRWFERGAASASDIAAGQAWRTVTALMLHVDGVHVAANAVATAVLVPPIVQRLGPGLGLWLVLLAGAVGNLLAAFAHDPRHVAVGASTAIFGAVGILAALRVLGAPPATRGSRRRWVVMAAGVVLLVMLGTGENVDVLAHVLGFAVGGALGAGAARIRRPPRRAVQWSLVALAALAVAGCWALAASDP